MTDEPATRESVNPAVAQPTENLKLSHTIEVAELLSGGAERRLHWEDIRERISIISDGHLFLGSALTSGASFIRGRQVFGGDHFSNTDELGPRHPDHVQGFGRCHRPNASVFYGSVNLETVFSELGLHVGDRVQTIEAHVKQGSEIPFMIVGEIDYVRRYGKSSGLFGLDLAEQIRSRWNELDEIARLRLNLSDAFIADRFRAEAKYPFEYKITSAFADIVFGMGIGAFFYPSVGHLGGWNIAIKKNAFDENFEIVKSTVHRIYDVPGYGIFGHIDELNSRRVSGNTIEWVDPKSTPKAFGSFAEFVRYALCLPGQKTLLIQTVSDASDEFSNDEINKALWGQGASKRVSRGILKFEKNGTAPLHPNIKFEEVRAFFDSHQKNWSMAFIDIGIGLETKDAQAVALHNLEQKIKQGDRSVSIFGRDGTPVISLGGSQVDPPGVQSKLEG